MLTPDDIREARLRKYLTQNDICDMLDVPLRQYQRLEMGERSLLSFRFGFALRLCRILELDPFGFLPEELPERGPEKLS